MFISNKPVRYGLKSMCCTDARIGYFYTDKDLDEKGLPNTKKKLQQTKSEYSLNCLLNF